MLMSTAPRTPQPRRMPSRRGARRVPVEHVGRNGFSWHVRLPEQTNAPMDSRKPRATVEIPDGTWVRSIPVAAARRLDAAIEEEPTCTAELSELVASTCDSCARRRVADMVARREYAALEAARKLMDDGYTRECSSRAVEWARQHRLIDDRRFADSFVRAKLGMGWGALRIERELAHKGVAADELPGWPEDYLGEDDEPSRAVELLERRRVPERNALPKFMRFLCSRGYSTRVARQAAAQVLDGPSEPV